MVNILIIYTISDSLTTLFSSSDFFAANPIAKDMMPS